MAIDSPSTSSGGSKIADYETATLACGFGAFNIYLLFLGLFDVTSTVLCATTMAYVIPAAECDLGLSIMGRGFLNSMHFLGMITTSIPWGFLTDTVGRRIFLIYAHLLDSIVVFLSGFSQNVGQLLAFKFFDGAIISGPLAVIMAYISEFSSKRYRPLNMLIVGTTATFGNFVLPILAYLVLPTTSDDRSNIMELHNWQIFIMITSIIPFLGGFLHIFFPESPKFLMSQGRNEDALKCLQLMYSINTGKPKDTYPITTLVNENPEKADRYEERQSMEYKTFVKNLSVKNKTLLVHKNFVYGLQQLRPLCSSPYLSVSILLYSIHFLIVFALNSVRLWVPQLFVKIIEYEHIFGDKGSSICTILAFDVKKTKLWPNDRNVTTGCEVYITTDSYINNLYIASAMLVTYILVSLIIDKVGHDRMLKISLAMASIIGFSLYYSTSARMTLCIASVFIAISNIAFTANATVSANLFPTDMRSMTIVMVLTFGRVGSVVGTLLFSYFISLGCLPPFLLVSAVLLLAFFLTFFIPNSGKVVFT